MRITNNTIFLKKSKKVTYEISSENLFINISMPTFYMVEMD